MPNCPKCNAPLRVNGRFCTRCGYECTNSAPSVNQSTPPYSSVSSGWQSPGSIPANRRKIPPYAPQSAYSDRNYSNDDTGLGKREKQIIAAVVLCAVILIFLMLILLFLFSRAQRTGSNFSGIAVSEGTTETVAPTDQLPATDIVSPSSNNEQTSGSLPSTYYYPEIPEENSIPTPEISAMPTIAPATTPPPSEAPTTDSKTINPEDYPEMIVNVRPTSTLGLRPEPDADAEQIAQLEPGEHVRVIDQSNAIFWYIYVPSLDTYGYVTAEYLTAIYVEEIETREIRPDCTIHVPRILMDSQDILRINERISNEICRLEPLEEANCIGIHYSSFSSNQILSLVIEKDFYDGNPVFYVINVAIDEQRELSNDEVANLYGLPQYKVQATDVISTYIHSSAGDYPEDALNGYIALSTTDENLATSALFINGEKHLCIVTSYYFPAGSLKHNVIFDLETGEIFFNI